MANEQYILLETEYFPSIAWYEKYLEPSDVYLDQHEYFRRASFRNRCDVAGPNGKLSLSVPLMGGRNQRIIMKDLKISYDTKWQTDHWRTLMTCYGRSPYFEFYQEPIQAIFQKKFTFLLDLNIESIRVINQLLDIKKQFHVTSEYIDSKLESVIDYRSQFTTHHYEPDRGIRYVQTFEEKTGFISGLSMLDLLFCEGKRAVNLLCSP